MFWQAPDQNRLTTAWYGRGTRVVDLSTAAPKELAWFIPTGADTWSAKPHNGYIYSGDIVAGSTCSATRARSGEAWPATSGLAEAQRARQQSLSQESARRQRFGTGARWPSQPPADGRAQGSRSFRTKVRVPDRKRSRRATLVVTFKDSAGRIVTRVRKRVRDNGRRQLRGSVFGARRALSLLAFGWGPGQDPEARVVHGEAPARGADGHRVRPGARLPTASSARLRAGRPPGSPAHGTRPPAWPDALAALIVAAVVFAFFGHAFLNYDSFYALVWGDDPAHGRTPQYDTPVAPTPHPLATLVGLVLSPLGATAAETIFLVIVLLAIGALVVRRLPARAGAVLDSVGVLAALIVATRVPLLNFGIRGYVDLPTIALVVWAAVLEARSPRRGAPVMVLLALAGLLRPEMWLFAAVYWLWCFPARDRNGRLWLAGIAALGPVIWMLSDWAVTGDPLWSLNGTTDLAAELGRRTGLGAVPGDALAARGDRAAGIPDRRGAGTGGGAGVGEAAA